MTAVFEEDGNLFFHAETGKIKMRPRFFLHWSNRHLLSCPACFQTEKWITNLDFECFCSHCGKLFKQRNSKSAKEHARNLKCLDRHGQLRQDNAPDVVCLTCFNRCFFRRSGTNQRKPPLPHKCYIPLVPEPGSYNLGVLCPICGRKEYSLCRVSRPQV